MIIKKYIEFISESIEEFNSFGEWVKSISDDEYIMNIVNRYINDSDGLYSGEDINPDIDLENAINLLDERTKEEIKSQIDQYLQSGIEEKEPIVLPSTETEELLGESLESQSEITIAGKGIFNSFLKCLTALGQKESNPNWNECDENFLIFYNFKNLDSNLVKQIFSRFRSLTNYLHLIDYSKNTVNFKMIN